MKQPHKKLTPRDAVLGIGRPATKEELEEYLDSPRAEEFMPIDQFQEEITEYLRKKNEKKKAS
ncbi:MAG: hypothetical protein JST90_18710 [Bacteroidetes bacterium]|nr:hypothetical protein [Bacteroidota bacterium]